MVIFARFEVPFDHDHAIRQENRLCVHSEPLVEYMRRIQDAEPDAAIARCLTLPMRSRALRPKSDRAGVLSELNDLLIKCGADWKLARGLIRLAERQLKTSRGTPRGTQ